MSNIIRILHIHGDLSIRGGIQNWLFLLLSRLDPERFAIDFLVSGEQDASVRSRIEAYGGRIIVCPQPRHPLKFACCFRRIVKQFGPYDLVHTHSYTYSGFFIALAYLNGIPVRIVHSHNAFAHLSGKFKIFRKIYNSAMQRLVQRLATGGLAVSNDAAVIMFGDNWSSDLRWRLLPCGIDLTQFERNVPKFETRQEFGNPDDSLVIGHVGRLSRARNHRFVLDVFKEVLRRRTGTRLLLVGDGPLRNDITEYARFLGIADHVILAGARNDVPRLLMGAMDAFIFPSLEEGLGLAAIEAQLAGLPVLTSYAVPLEAEIFPDTMRRMSLTSPPSQWAESLLAMIDESPDYDRNAVAAIRGSSLDIEENARALMKFYENQVRVSRFKGKGRVKF